MAERKIRQISETHRIFYGKIRGKNPGSIITTVFLNELNRRLHPHYVEKSRQEVIKEMIECGLLKRINKKAYEIIKNPRNNKLKKAVDFYGNPLY